MNRQRPKAITVFYVLIGADLLSKMPKLACLTACTATRFNERSRRRKRIDMAETHFIHRPT